MELLFGEFSFNPYKILTAKLWILCYNLHENGIILSHYYLPTSNSAGYILIFLPINVVE